MTKQELDLIKEELSNVQALEDFYSRKYQKFNRPQDQDFYLEYRGQETGMTKLLDILKVSL